MSLLLGQLGKKTKTPKGKAIPKGKIAELQDHVVALETEIHAQVRRVKEAINAPGVLGKLVDLGFGRDDGGNGDGFDAVGEILEKVCDEVAMETICGRVRDSWEDALDGVLAVKVKIWK